MIVVLVLIFRGVADISTQLEASAQALEELTGAYVEMLAPDACDFHPTGGGSMERARAVIGHFSSGVLRLHGFPTTSSRVLHTQKRRLPINVLQSKRPDDVARGDGSDLVVKSEAPGRRRWSQPRALQPEAKTLIETISLSKSSVTYRAVYHGTSGAIAGRPFELALRKCETANVDDYLLSSRMKIRSLESCVGRISMRRAVHWKPFWIHSVA